MAEKTLEQIFQETANNIRKITTKDGLIYPKNMAEELRRVKAMPGDIIAGSYYAYTNKVPTILENGAVVELEYTKNNETRYLLPYAMQILMNSYPQTAINPSDLGYQILYFQLAFGNTSPIPLVASSLLKSEVVGFHFYESGKLYAMSSDFSADLQKKSKNGNVYTIDARDATSSPGPIATLTLEPGKTLIHLDMRNRYASNKWVFSGSSYVMYTSFIPLNENGMGLLS